MAIRGRPRLGHPPVTDVVNDGVSHRRLALVAAVVLAHGAGLWALQAGLLRRVVAMVVPVDVVVASNLSTQPELVTPLLPPRPPSSPQARTSWGSTAVVKPQATAPLIPQPLEVSAPGPAPASASTGDGEPLPAAAAVVPGSPSVQAESQSPPAPPRIELPSSEAEYLHNPPTPYPPLSKRLGEQGQVVVRVFIDTRGVATQGELVRSSGYPRLDQTALETTLRWRYRPGKPAGVTEGMWFDVPISFILE
jgi:protein TonB